MTEQSVFVHGAAAIPEFIGSRAPFTPWPLLRVRSEFGAASVGENLNPSQEEWDLSDHVGLRATRGGHFRGGAGFTNAFHFAIPTPLMTDGERVRVRAVWLNFEREEAAAPQQVIVSDGDSRMANFRFTPTDLDLNERFVLDQEPTVSFGLLVSVVISFTGEHHVRFRCAGAEFLTP